MALAMEKSMLPACFSFSPAITLPMSLRVAAPASSMTASMAAAIATMRAISDPEIGFHEHVTRLGDRMRAGLTEITERHSIPAIVSGLGSVFVTYFMDGPVRGYRDLLRNNDTAYAMFHRRMTDEGFMMYPMTLKRNHISGAHTEEHIDRTLEAADRVLGGMAHEGVFG